MNSGENWGTRSIRRENAVSWYCSTMSHPLLVVVVVELGSVTVLQTCSDKSEEINIRIEICIHRHT